MRSTRWRANVPRSTAHPLNPFRMAVLDVAIAGERAVFAYVSIDPRGQEQRGDPSVTIDGEHHLMEHGVGYVAKWVAPRVLEVTATKDGRPTGCGRYEVSPDGQTLTISYATARMGTATIEHRLVFDRVA